MSLKLASNSIKDLLMVPHHPQPHLKVIVLRLTQYRFSVCHQQSCYSASGGPKKTQDNILFYFISSLAEDKFV